MFRDVDSIPSEVWVDDEGLPRRVVLTISTEAGGQPVELQMSMDLFDYGVDVNVEPPTKFEELPAPVG